MLASQNKTRKYENKMNQNGKTKKNVMKAAKQLEKKADSE